MAITYQDVANGITDIAYSADSKHIVFNYKGDHCTMRVPLDVMLADDKESATWIARNYGFILSVL